MATSNLTFKVKLEFELTHAAPQAGSTVTPCCGHTPFELKRSDSLTADTSLVTCPGAFLREASA